MKRLKKFAIIALTVLGVTITNVTPGSAAAFVKFDGIDGESMNNNADPQRGIDLGDPTTPLARLARRGDEPGELVFERGTDRASALLRRWATEDRHFDTLVVYVPQPRSGYGGSRTIYFQYELTNVMVRSWSISGDADDRPTEEVAFYYNKIELVAEDETATTRADRATTSRSTR